MTKETAVGLGAEDGIENVEIVLREQGRSVVIATLRDGHLGWDEEAAQNLSHRARGVPEEHRVAYYEAYASSARTRAEEIRDE